MANWVLDGDPGLDLWHMDVRRFGPALPLAGLHAGPQSARTTSPTTTSATRAPSARRDARCGPRPPTPWHAAHGAAFGEKAGWERVNHYAQGSGAAADDGAPRGWAGHGTGRRASSPSTGRCARRRALFDETSFAKIEITGPEAAGFCAHVFAGQVGRPPGALVVHPGARTTAAAIEMDVTVTPPGADAFLVVTGTAFGPHDLGWLRARPGGPAPTCGSRT